MKVWHLLSNRWNSAISEYALSSAKALRRLGAQTLVTCLHESPIEQRFQDAGFQIQPVDGFGPGKYSVLAAKSKQFLPDVIFTYGGPETTAAFFFKGKSRLIRFHGYAADAGNRLQQTTRRLGHVHVDCVLAPSKTIAKTLESQMACPVHAVTLGVDTAVFRCAEITRDARPELLIFGRIDPVKGHREFMALFKSMIALSETKKTPRPRLKIVGLPANLSKKHLLEHAAAIGLDRGDFEIQCDRVFNVAELMSKVSLGVISSLGSEAICRVAQEFLLCGTPVVTTDVGSLPDVFCRPEFGQVYGRHDNQGAVTIVFDALMASHGESLDARRSRSASAQMEFSIESMSEQLRPYVQGEPSDLP
jgi:glycosyltransferase involved in cell wall biosynthesis